MSIMILKYFHWIIYSSDKDKPFYYRESDYTAIIVSISIAIIYTLHSCYLTWRHSKWFCKSFLSSAVYPHDSHLHWITFVSNPSISSSSSTEIDKSSCNTLGTFFFGGELTHGFVWQDFMCTLRSALELPTSSHCGHLNSFFLLKDSLN